MVSMSFAHLVTEGKPETVIVREETGRQRADGREKMVLEANANVKCSVLWMQREKGQASEKQFTAIYTSSAFSLLKYE